MPVRHNNRRRACRGVRATAGPAMPQRRPPSNPRREGLRPSCSLALSPCISSCSLHTSRAVTVRANVKQVGAAGSAGGGPASCGRCCELQAHGARAVWVWLCAPCLSRVQPVPRSSDVERRSKHDASPDGVTAFCKLVYGRDEGGGEGGGHEQGAQAQHHAREGCNLAWQTGARAAPPSDHDCLRWVPVAGTCL